MAFREKSRLQQERCYKTKKSETSVTASHQPLYSDSDDLRFVMCSCDQATSPLPSTLRRSSRMNIGWSEDGKHFNKPFEPTTSSKMKGFFPNLPKLSSSIVPKTSSTVCLNDNYCFFKTTPANHLGID